MNDTVYDISDTCVIVPLNPMIDNFTISVTSRHLAFKHAECYLGMNMINSVMRCMPVSGQFLDIVGQDSSDSTC